MTAALQARRQARRVAHNAALSLPYAYEAITVNDDFTDALSDVRYLARTRRPLVIMTQESKRTDYRQRLDDGWGVTQRMTDDSTAGVAVIWNRGLVRAIGTTNNRPSELGRGYLPLVVPVHGEDMLTRGVVWQDLEVRTSGYRFRLYSTHRPPQRHRHLWPAFDDNLEQFIEASPIPVLGGTDNNQPGGPDVDDDLVRWCGIGIDGFTTSPGLRVLSVYELDHRNSDHRAVSGAVLLRSPRGLARVPA